MLVHTLGNTKCRGKQQRKERDQIAVLSERASDVLSVTVATEEDEPGEGASRQISMITFKKTEQ